MFDEKRRYPRKSRDELVFVNVMFDSGDPVAEATRYECSIRDVSVSGVKLHGSHAFANGARLEMMAVFGVDDNLLKLVGVVKWRTVTIEKEYLTGVEFIEDESEDIELWRQRLQGNQQ